MNLSNLRIAISATEFIYWGGGVDLIRLITKGLSSQIDTHNLELFLVVERKPINKLLLEKAYTIKNFIFNVLNIKKTNYPKPLLNSRKQITQAFTGINSKIKIVFCTNLNKFLKNHNIDVILPFSQVPENIEIPWIGYIYDFQHEYLPKFFTNNEIDGRRKLFHKMLNSAKTVIVNSKAVKKDIEKFYKNYRAEIVSLPLAPYPLKEWLKTHELKKYNLPDKFFLISNQFWIHKSHMTAFEALKRLLGKPDINNIHIVCTGKEEEFRDPNYIPRLKEYLSVNHITKYVHFLGYIPKNDQIEIMKRSIAVIQTTLFEGGPGGGAVYDAIAINKPAIVSDIAINKEIKENNIIFFKAGSSIELSEKMYELVKNPTLYKINPKELLKKGAERTKKLGETLMSAIHCTMHPNLLSHAATLQKL